MPLFTAPKSILPTQRNDSFRIALRNAFSSHQVQQTTTINSIRFSLAFSPCQITTLQPRSKDMHFTHNPERVKPYQSKYLLKTIIY
jgi:hypothetical protein